MKILVTGVAGFIGMHVAHRLLEQGVEVVGIDNLNDYYDVALKEDRLKQLTRSRRLPARCQPCRTSWRALFAKESPCLYQ